MERVDCGHDGKNDEEFERRGEMKRLSRLQVLVLYCKVKYPAMTTVRYVKRRTRQYLGQ